LQKEFEAIKRRNGIGGQLMNELDDASIQQADYSFAPEQLDKLDELAEKQSIMSQVTRGSKTNNRLDGLRNITSVQKVNVDENTLSNLRSNDAQRAQAGDHTQDNNRL